MGFLIVPNTKMAVFGVNRNYYKKRTVVKYFWEKQHPSPVDTSALALRIYVAKAFLSFEVLFTDVYDLRLYKRNANE